MNASLLTLVLLTSTISAPAPLPRPHILAGTWELVERTAKYQIEFLPSGKVGGKNSLKRDNFATAWSYCPIDGSFAVETHWLSNGEYDSPWCLYGYIDPRTGQGWYSWRDGDGPHVIRRLEPKEGRFR